MTRSRLSLEVNADGGGGWSDNLNLVNGIHTSYPYVVIDDGAIYCVPETHQAREIALYRATSFPVTWEKAP